MEGAMAGAIERAVLAERLSAIRAERAAFELRSNLMAAQMRGAEAVLEDLLARVDAGGAAAAPADGDGAGHRPARAG